MKGQRLSKECKAQLLVADRVVVYRGSKVFGGDVWHIQLFRGDMTAFVWGGAGILMQYPSSAAAIRTVRRLRPDVRLELVGDGGGEVLADLGRLVSAVRGNGRARSA